MTNRNSATTESDSGPQRTSRDGHGATTDQLLPAPDVVKPQSHDRPPDLVKKIGKTTYKVWAHFSETSRETLDDKINRMLREDVRRMMQSDGDIVNIL